MSSDSSRDNEFADECFRCPVSGCAGHVELVTEQDIVPHWNCAECGSIWYKKENLLKEISGIVKRFPYRKRCYRKSHDGWAPADSGKISLDYERYIGGEPEDGREDAVRG
jgi:hypothetical protein